MYKKILVPLDGSELAECVLPHVESIARGCGTSSVVFIRAVPPYEAEAYSSYVLDKANVKKINDLAEGYIKKIASQARYDGVKVSGEIIMGSPADIIADYATKNEVDLIVIATHGRSGVSRWVWGSVADRVLRSACVPVLMIRAPGCVPGV